MIDSRADCGYNDACETARYLQQAARLFSTLHDLRCLGKDEVGSSNLPSSSKTKGHPKGCPFVLESDRRRRPPVMPGVKIAYSEGESRKKLDTTD